MQKGAEIKRELKSWKKKKEPRPGERGEKKRRTKTTEEKNRYNNFCGPEQGNAFFLLSKKKTPKERSEGGKRFEGIMVKNNLCENLSRRSY